MRVLQICLEFDCAGVAWNLSQALNKLPNVESKHVMHSVTHATKHTDMMFDDSKEILDLCEWADVLHFHQWIWTYQPGKNSKRLDFDSEAYSKTNIFKNIMQSKKVVFHFHGGNHQLAPEYWVDECERYQAAIFKCDPLVYIRNSCWMPNVLGDFKTEDIQYDSDDFGVAIMGGVRDPRRNNGHIEQVLKYLGMRYKFFKDTPFDEAIADRPNYHVSIDNLTQGFIGMWGWESMAMGQPVIARLSNTTKNAYSRVGVKLPVVCVENVDGLARKLTEFRDNRRRLREVGSTSNAWMNAFYPSERIAAQYVEKYSVI